MGSDGVEISTARQKWVEAVGSRSGVAPGAPIVVAHDHHIHNAVTAARPGPPVEDGVHGAVGVYDIRADPRQGISWPNVLRVSRCAPWPCLPVVGPWLRSAIALCWRCAPPR